MWSYLNARPPRTVFDVYNDTATALNKARAQKITNALNQIKLNYAPQMAQQAADKGAANVSIAQSDAAYEPRMNQASLGMKNAQITATQLESAGRRLDNVSKYYQAIGAPQDVQNKLKIQQAQLGLLYAKTKLAGQGGRAGQKNAAIYLDPNTGAPVPNPFQSDSNGEPNSGMPPPSPTSGASAAPPPDIAAPMSSPQVDGAQRNAPAPPASMPTIAPTPASADASTPTLPGANPNAPNVLESVGPPDSRGHAAAFRNLRTGERFSVLTPTGRTKMQNQLMAIKQAIPYLDDLKNLGTVGSFGAAGMNKLLPNGWGGVPIGVAAKYDASRDAAVEHMLTGSALNKTDETIGMMKTILTRQNLETGKDYIDRLNHFQTHLRILDDQVKNSLGINMMSLDSPKMEQAFLKNEYAKAIAIDKTRPGMVYVDNGEGKKGYISEKEWNDPANKKEIAKYKRLD
jgi:hypothetical protein